ncbi:pol protein [Cucumis melo var. makuwa]|uniref:Pol protein n=1 Tax=Cucumis melo var. makuwa TaxID=1194695 RepID=A0A5D3CAL8_CUCMM|nr:pol protein [Cucumis melo var. makuwa]TYK08903.1 pol protein [Cucumis melo var. makuwa]
MNVVANAHSRKISHSAALITRQTPLYQDFERAEIAVSVGVVDLQLAQLSVQLTLRQNIVVTQCNDPYLVEKWENVSEWKWENVSMDFITGLPRTLRGFTVIWIVVDRLTKSAHFIPGKSTYTASKWAQLYLTEIAAMGTSFQATISMTPFEAFYGKCCRSPICWNEEYVSDPSHVVDYEPLEIDENLSYTERPVGILAREPSLQSLPLIRRISLAVDTNIALRLRRCPPRNADVQSFVATPIFDPPLHLTEVTLEFFGFTASLVGVNSPLLGWFCFDADLNKNFSYISGKGNAKGKPARGKKDA